MASITPQSLPSHVFPGIPQHSKSEDTRNSPMPLAVFQSFYSFRYTINCIPLDSVPKDSPWPSPGRTNCTGRAEGDGRGNQCLHSRTEKSIRRKENVISKPLKTMYLYQHIKKEREVQKGQTIYI